MSKNLRIFTYVYFSLAILYGIFELMLSAISGSVTIVGNIIMYIVLIASSLLGIFMPSKKTKEIISFLLLPIFVITLDLLVGSITALLNTYSPMLLFMLVVEIAAAVTIVIAIVLSKITGFLPPLIVGLVETSLLLILVSIGFLAILVALLNPLVVLGYISLYAFIVTAFVLFIVLISKHKQLKEVTSSANEVSLEKVSEPSAVKEEVHQEKDAIEMIEKLKKLYDSGAITQEEYEEKRKKYIGLL